MKDKHLHAFMRTAHTFAELSHARKLKVGAIAVKDGRIISIGYNGMPEGWPNDCEHVIGHEPDGTPILKTNPEVLHAEMNCLMKLAKSTESGLGATMFITHSPCMECAKGIHQAGIGEVYYANDYKSDAGRRFLDICGVPVRKLMACDNP